MHRVTYPDNEAGRKGTFKISGWVTGAPNGIESVARRDKMLAGADEGRGQLRSCGDSR